MKNTEYIEGLLLVVLVLSFAFGWTAGFKVAGQACQQGVSNAR